MSFESDEDFRFHIQDLIWKLAYAQRLRHCQAINNRPYTLNEQMERMHI